MSYLATHDAATRLPLERARVLASDYYTDSRLFDEETEQVFYGQWYPIAHVSQVPVGGYYARNLINEPILVTRSVDGAIRVLVNVCRHRAAVLLEGCGKLRGSRIVCPYHSWTYGADGELVGAPWMDGVEPLGSGDTSLAKVRFEIWNGFVFINLSGTAKPLAPQLESIKSVVSEYSLGDLTVVDLEKFECDWNWKASLDNFIEVIHQPAVHPGVDYLIPAGRSQYHQADGPFSYRFLNTRDGGITPGGLPSIEGVSDSSQRRLVSLNVFPALHLLLQRNQMLWIDFDVRGVDTHTLQLRMLVPESTLDFPDYEKERDVFSSIMSSILVQDITICRRVRDGMRSKYAKPGRLSAMERPLHQFHNFLLDAMGR